jgi:predicted helicase
MRESDQFMRESTELDEAIIFAPQMENCCGHTRCTTTGYSCWNTDVVGVDDTRIKWTRQVKASLQKGHSNEVDIMGIRQSLYRPFSKQHLYFSDFWNEERYKQHRFFPLPETENVVMCLSAIGQSKPFHTLAADVIPDLHLTGDSQCFTLYTYDEDGNNDTMPTPIVGTMLMPTMVRIC